LHQVGDQPRLFGTKYAWSQNTAHELQNSYSSPKIVRQTKLMKTGHVGHISKTKKTRKTKKFP